MKGFKAIHSAETTHAGIELHHMLRNEEHLQPAGSQSIFEQCYGLAAYTRLELRHPAPGIIFTTKPSSIGLVCI